MYVKGTILTLKDPKPADPETGEDFPYNTVEVIGESPVSHSDKGGWTGPDAAGVLLTAKSNFGSTLDEPFGKLRTLYDVESIPEAIVETTQTVKVVDGSTSQAGPTPEEVFADEAPGVPPEEGQSRGRTKVSPLGETRNEAADGPLGEVENPDPPKPEAPDSPLD